MPNGGVAIEVLNYGVLRLAYGHKACSRGLAARCCSGAMQLFRQLPRNRSRPPSTWRSGKGARSFVLRAALSLAKLYQSTGRPADAHAVLAPALEGFSPTPEMPEIAEAQALLAALANGQRGTALRDDRPIEPRPPVPAAPYPVLKAARSQPSNSQFGVQPFFTPFALPSPVHWAVARRSASLSFWHASWRELPLLSLRWS